MDLVLIVLIVSVALMFIALQVCNVLKEICKKGVKDEDTENIEKGK